MKDAKICIYCCMQVQKDRQHDLIPASEEAIINKGRHRTTLYNVQYRMFTDSLEQRTKDSEVHFQLQKEWENNVSPASVE